MIRVLLADDHPVVRAGLRALLANESDIEVVGEAVTGAEAQELAVTLHPDVVLLDLRMPGPPAVETVWFVHSQSPPVRVVMLTAHLEQAAIRELVRQGVAGYVLKDDEPMSIARAIRCAVAGGRWFSPDVMSALAQRQDYPTTADEILHLTDREKQILELIKKGLDNSRIAGELSLREQTVRNYLSVLYGKLGVTSRAGAVVWTHEHEFMEG